MDGILFLVHERMYYLSFRLERRSRELIHIATHFCDGHCVHSYLLWVASHFLKKDEERISEELNTNARLRSRRANNSGSCPFCGQNEDVPHLFLFCRRARLFWQVILADPLPDSIEQLWDCNLIGPGLASGKLKSTVLTVILWNIWKCRNAKVFRNEEEVNRSVLGRPQGLP
ncbi:hypothetical protein EJB05_35627 [Eragrostis curvula]|uniref:Reverse transcriptase zinc-binding domain-containing protein n=1 Tax=Eragrostis curvula TaxID=38414 RepID=A0A5J9U7D8_9POAL|nr:hypothetical protein EJB05_35627 [Eragrostis curvula]